MFAVNGLESAELENPKHRACSAGGGDSLRRAGSTLGRRNIAKSRLLEEREMTFRQVVSFSVAP